MHSPFNRCRLGMMVMFESQTMQKLARRLAGLHDCLLVPMNAGGHSPGGSGASVHTTGNSKVPPVSKQRDRTPHTKGRPALLELCALRVVPVQCSSGHAVKQKHHGKGSGPGSSVMRRHLPKQGMSCGHPGAISSHFVCVLER